MTDNIETTGYWHFSSDDKHSYAGNLQNDNNEISITLLGCTKVPKEPFIIHGTTATGKKITLYKCHLQSRRMAFPGIPSVEVSALYCFKGEHLTADTLNFNSSLIKFSDLNEWVSIGGFEKFESNEETCAIEYKNPEPIIFYEDDTIQLVLLFQLTSPLYRPKHDCTLIQQTLILIKHKSIFNLDKFWDYVSTITSFLTLAYFSEPRILQIQFKQEEKTIDCNYAGQKIETSQKKKNKSDFLFTYKIIKSDFISVFRKWTELKKIIEPVFNVFQECFGSRNIINENKFLNVMQGIETFHRRIRHNKKEQDNIHKSKVSEIIKSCPVEYQNWLKEKLNFSNEPTLQERLKELFDEINTDLKNRLFPKHNEIIMQSKNSRNYYTHYSASLEKKALKGTELFYLTERLKILLLILLLKETNISEEQVKTIITDSSNFLFNHLITKDNKPATNKSIATSGADTAQHQQ